MKQLSNLSKNIKPSLTRKLFSMAKQLDDVVDFTLGDPDIQPNEKIKLAACEAIKAGKTRYSQNAGLLDLRRVIAEKYEKEYGMHYSPETEILVSVGGMEGLYLSLLAILNAGDEVIIPMPYWINYAQMVQMCGAVPVLVESKSADDLSVSVENIRQAVTEHTKAIIINTPSNPSGLVIDETDLQKLAQVAKEHDLYVIADEVYKKIIYDGKKFSSIATIDGMKERTVLINSLSKEFCMTGYRLGYVAAPATIIAVMTPLQENIAACAPLPSQYAAIEALCHGDLYSKSSVSEYEKRKDALVEEIADIKGLSLREPEATFYAMVNIKATGLSSEEFAYKLLEKAHVAVVPGITYGKCCEGFVRIAFTIEENKIREGIRRIKEFVESL
ncbi:MAG: pyridoxal phosphate-dependent aminotransferase [Treponema sp.]|nr:pyridoxal phosphate-dependent aminotransferase [Treponema sp.]